MNKLLLTIFVLNPILSFANNGQIAFSNPIASISIDGDTSDWPSKLTRTPIANSEAWFMSGYNVEQQCLYLLVQTKDTTNMPGQSEGNVWGRKRDRILVYVDPEHRIPVGSGIIMLFGSSTGVELWKTEPNWDPYNQTFSEHHTELAVKRSGDYITYEWKIKLEQSIAKNRSLGFDIVLQDCDNNKNVTEYKWGQGSLKNRVPSRLGDLVLAGKKQKLVYVKGKMEWSDTTSAPLPPAVLIQNKRHASMWVLSKVDSTGFYEANLPRGRYLIRCGFRTTHALDYEQKQRVDDKSFVSVKLRKKRITPPNLKISPISSPENHIPKTGLLYRWQSADSTNVTQFVNKLQDYYAIPGVSLALIHDGKLVYNKQFGSINAITGEKASAEHRWETASISKALFAFAVLRLAERNQISLDKALFDYLPFENIVDDERSKLITARHILSHQSGLPNWAFSGPSGWKNGQKTKLLFEPGERFEYSGEGYEYLSRVLESITGKSIRAIMQDEVYDIMGMTESDLVANETNIHLIGIGHASDMPQLWDLERDSWIAGSMLSTTSDLAKYMTGLMNQKGLSIKTYDEMFAPQVENTTPFHQFFGGTKVFHSLGFEVQETENGRIYHHGGNNGDYQGRWAMDLNRMCGYVVLTNSNAGFYFDQVLQQFLVTGK